MVLDVGGGRGDVRLGLDDVFLSGALSAVFGYHNSDTVSDGVDVLLSEVQSVDFGDHGGEMVGGGFDVLLSGVRSAIFGYRSGNTVGGGVGEPEERWGNPLGRVGG